MSWQKEIDELNKRKNLAQKLGGKEKIERQHEANRNTIRERINLFFDLYSIYTQLKYTLSLQLSCH